MGNITSWVTAALTALAMVAITLVVTLAASPAHAGWTDVSGLTTYRLCRAPTPSGQGWVFTSRVRKRADTADARAGVVLVEDGQPRQRWSSGWLEDGVRERGRVRIARTRGVRLQVRQEAGDRDSAVGTATELRVLRPREVRHCDRWRR